MKISNNLVVSTLLIAAGSISCMSSDKNDFTPPNIVFVLTDDQGYGDIAAHGNPWLITPVMDKMHDEGVRFSNFHVGTTCAPSRAGLLTGQYPNKVNVWHTVKGRQMLREGELTLADMLGDHGYKSGIFGKWHLGENYPFRPQDRGFDEVLIHGGGGIVQTPDFWNNNYFDDTYFRNGKPEKFEGYCTDVWFSEAIKWIDHVKHEPFFCFIATNAPHSPYHVEDRYTDLYRDNNEIVNPEFYGMITNLDENLGRLIEYLKNNDLYNNTILIFMGDNGSSAGAKLDREGFVTEGYNAGLRGMKSSPYDGGHLVPFFLIWENGNLPPGKNIERLTSFVDFVPTILELCRIPMPSEPEFDGISLKPLIKGNDVDWPKRTVVIDTQREEFLIKDRNYSVMTDRWRLVRGRELFDIIKDPGQKVNLIDEFPHIRDSLLQEYEKWWKLVSVNQDDYQYARAGGGEIPLVLTAHDKHNIDGQVAFNQERVRLGVGDNGFWAVAIPEKRNYTIELRRWPMEAYLALSASAPPGDPVPGGRPFSGGKALFFKEARIEINNQVYSKKVDNNDKGVVFNIELDKGNYELTTWMTEVNGFERGAYYVYIW